MFRLFIVFIAATWSLSVNALTVTATSTPTTCTPCNGSITATASSGQIPYQYSIDGGVTWQSAQLFSNECAGTYTITARDANLVTAITTVTVVQNAPLSFTVTGVNCTAYNLCNGQINVSISGGVPPYTIRLQWSSNTQYFSSSPITNLCPATYTVNVIDGSNNCGSGYNNPVVVTIGVGPPPGPGGLMCTTGYSVGQCNVICDNTLSIYGSGGTPPYTYSLNGGPYSSVSTITNLCEGPNTYTVCVRDALLNTWCVQAYYPTNYAYQRMPPAVTAAGCTCDGTITFAQPAQVGEQFYLYTSSMTLVTQNSSGVFTGVCGGTYSAQCYYNGCWNMFMVTVPTNPSFSVAFSTTNPTCYGGCNGTITCNPAPWSATGYEYSKDNGVTWQSSNVLTGLCAGTYTVRVKDSTNCYGNYTQMISNPPQLSLTVSYIQPNCLNGNCYGGFICTPATGPNAPYQWTDNGGSTWQTSNQFLNLCAGGPYTIGVKDTLGCTRILNPYTMPSNLNQFYLGNLHNNPTCANPCGGSIALTLGSSNAPAAYNLYSIDSGMTWQSSLSFPNLCAGTYYAQAMNTLTGCYSAFLTIVLSPPVALAVAATVTQAACPTSCNGAINASITAGSNPPYQYSQDGGVTWQSTGSFTGLCAGTYTITAKNALNCTATQTVVVNSAPVISASAITTEPSCYGSCDATLSAAPTTGPGYPYQYSINGGANWYTSNLFAGICAGNVTLTVKDSFNCTTSVPLNISSPPPVVTYYSLQNPTCASTCDGNIYLNPATPPGYEYSIDSSVTWSSSNTFSTLCAGTYYVDIRDSNGCAAGISILTLTAGSSPTASASATPLCNSQCNAAINITPGSAGSYQYSLDSGVTWQSGNTFSSLCAGSYYYTVADTNGCTVSGNVVIAQPAALTVTSVSDSATCFASCNGSFTLSPSAPGVYQYSIDSGVTWQSSETFNGLCAGNYYYTLQDTNACATSGNVVIGQPAHVTIIVDSIINVSCHSNCDGAFYFAPSGWTASSIDSGLTWQSATPYDSLCAGEYIMIAENTAGCRDTAHFNIMQPDALMLQAAPTNNLCYGDTSGSVQLSSNGNNPQYSIDGGATWTSDTTFGNLASGTYTVLVHDVNGCTSTNSFVITSPPALSVSTACTFPSYCGCTGQMTPYGVGGVPVYTYTISPVNQQTGLCPGNYLVTTTDANGCTASAPFVIGQATPLQIDSIVTTPAVAPNNDGTATVYFHGGYMLYNVMWDSAAGFQPFTTATNLAPGTYCVTVTDGMGCMDTACVTVDVITAAGNMEMNYSIFPNPANTSFVIEGMSSTVHVMLYDAAGRMVNDYGDVNMNPAGQYFELPADVASGSYVIRMQYGDAVFQHELMIVK